MKENLKRTSKITGAITLACLASFVIFGLGLGILGEDSANFIMMNPFISGFLHGGVEHFLFNIIFIFLLLLPLVNSSFDFKKIFWLTFFISLVYLPVSVLGITSPAIGISGTCAFLASRYFLTWGKNKYLGIGILGFLIFCEIFSMSDPNNHTAHGVHFIGYLLGFISLKITLYQKLIPSWIYNRISVV